MEAEFPGGQRRASGPRGPGQVEHSESTLGEVPVIGTLSQHRICIVAAMVGALVILTSPVNMLGSGITIVPSVPVISTTPVLASGESKLKTLWLMPPSTYLAMALTWVGTSTSNTVPARSPPWMVRVARLVEPTAATVSTEPKTCTSAVM